MLGKGNSCFNNLQKALDDIRATGLFLRRYQNDVSHSEFNGAVPKKVIDFRNDAQRIDYLNTEISIFIEPELSNAEMYFHTLLAQQHVEERAASQRRLMESPPSSPLSRARAANAARTVRDNFGNIPPLQFTGVGTNGEYAFPVETSYPNFPLATKAANAVGKAYNSVQNFINQPVGKMVGLVDSNHTSPESVLSSTSNHSRSSASSDRSASKSPKGKQSMRRARSHEVKSKSKRYTLKARAKSY